MGNMCEEKRRRSWLNRHAPQPLDSTPTVGDPVRGASAFEGSDPYGE